MIKVMLCKPDAVVLMAVLGPCRIHCNMEMQEYIAKQVDKLEPENSADFCAASKHVCCCCQEGSHENVEWQTK
jgi:hypothetical protein